MDNHGCKLSPHVCNLLINGFVRASKLEQEIHFFREMESKGCSPPLVVYNTLINGLCKAERFCHAYSFVKEMLKRDWKPDSITYSLLIMALNLWRQALDKGLEPYVTFWCMALLCWENWRCFAVLFKYEAVELNCLPNLVAHNTLMDGI